MRAAVITGFGPPDVLTVHNVPVPRPQADEVLVHVRAAAINPKDTFIRKGRFKRFTGEKFPIQTGFDFAGEVAEIGPGVTDSPVGEAVYGMLDGWQGGTCAEYVSVSTGRLCKKPEGVSFDEAAALPLVSLTALQALRDRAAELRSPPSSLNSFCRDAILLSGMGSSAMHRWADANRMARIATVPC